MLHDPPSARSLLWRLPLAALRFSLLAAIVLLWPTFFLALLTAHAGLLGVAIAALLLARFFVPEATATATRGLVAACNILLGLAVYVWVVVVAMALVAVASRDTCSTRDIWAIVCAFFFGLALLTFTDFVAAFMLWFADAGPREPPMPDRPAHTLATDYDNRETDSALRRRRQGR